VHAREAPLRRPAALVPAARRARRCRPMTALAAPAPVAMEHEAHHGPLLACSICRGRSSRGVFRRRYWALRSRRTGIALARR